MNFVIFLYYLSCTILTVTIGKLLNQPFPITHWLLLFLGVILGLIFQTSKSRAFFNGFLASFLVAITYTIAIYVQSPIMTQKFSKILNIQPVGLIFLIALLQGLLLGLSSLTGAWLRKILF